jgi:hypothetical protein
VTRGWTKLGRDLFSSSIIRIIKSRRDGWACSTNGGEEERV